MRAATYTRWRKSSRSGGADNCVEVAVAPEGIVGVRDSKDPTGPVLEFDPDTWAAFIAALKAGDLQPAADHPTGSAVAGGDDDRAP